MTFSPPFNKHQVFASPLSCSSDWRRDHWMQRVARWVTRWHPTATRRVSEGDSSTDVTQPGDRGWCEWVDHATRQRRGSSPTEGFCRTSPARGAPYAATSTINRVTPGWGARG